MRHLLLAAIAAASFWSSNAHAEVPQVVASIKPVHALVAAVMGDLGTPALLVKGAASPHTYSLRPSDAAALEASDIVFWTGHGLELFLESSIETLAPRARLVELAEAPGITLLAPREGGTFEAHAHDDHEEREDHDEHAGHEHHDHSDHDHDEADMHFFLDPRNAIAMVAAIEQALSAVDPEHAGAYRANAEGLVADLEALIAETDAALAPVRNRPFIVFHDAYQYFESRFGLNLVGSITVSPEVSPGAERIAEIREKLKTLDAACVFAEPNFDPRLAAVLVEGTGARAGELDPEGASLAEGPQLYRQLIENLASGLKACLAN